VLRVETRIRAPTERCFDLARSVETHLGSTSETGEKAIGGVTTGLLGPGDWVTWEAVHLGIKQRLTAQITRFERPHVFVDEMIRGAFASFTHTHEFRSDGDATLMVDTFSYVSPLGWLGVLADKLFLERYMTSFLRKRAEYLKRVAEEAQ